MWCRMQSIASKITDGEHSTPKREAIYSGYYLISARNILNSGMDFSKVDFVSKETYNILSKRCSPQIGDVLLSCSGTVGRCCVCSASNCVMVRSVALIAPISISSRYLQYAIQSFVIQKQIQEKQKQVAQANIFQAEIKALFFPLPPLAEQQRIVEQIETLLKYVDIIDADAETLEKSISLAKQKILDLAIRGKLVPQDPTDEPASELLKKIKAEKEALVKAGKIKKDKHESFIFKGDDNCYHENIDGKVTDVTEDIPFDLPDEWEWCRLSTISEFDLGKTLDRQKNTGNYRKYLRSVNVLWGNIDLSDVKEMRFEDTELERYSIKKGDLLICEGGDVGRCAVWNKDFVFYYQNALHRVRFYQKCIPLFYQFVMMFFENTGLLKKISQGVTIKHLTKNTLNSMFFPLPPLAEQKRIVSQVEKLFAVLETMLG